jgi:hypothetical protein
MVYPLPVVANENLPSPPDLTTSLAQLLAAIFNATALIGSLAASLSLFLTHPDPATLSTTMTIFQ